MSLFNLKPCPFCGKDDAYLDIGTNGSVVYSRVICGNCGSQTRHFKQPDYVGGSEFIEKAVKSWNTRSGSKPCEPEDDAEKIYKYESWTAMLKEQPKHITTRIANALVRNDIRNMEHLYEILSEGKTKIKNIGPDSLRILAEILIKNGYDENTLKKYLKREENK